MTDLKLHLEPWLRGTAEFWVSRVETHKGHGGPVDGFYHINHVMPPDEYVDGVDDGILANFGAATILRKAAAMAVAGADANLHVLHGFVFVSCAVLCCVCACVHACLCTCV